MSKNFKLLRDFILPSLEEKTYGHHLQWENKENGNFRISRIHQSSGCWNEDCMTVYKAWSTKKKLWKADDPKRVTKAKHRLVAALRRNPSIEMLKNESQYYRFRFLESNEFDEDRYFLDETELTNSDAAPILTKDTIEIPKCKKKEHSPKDGRKCQNSDKAHNMNLIEDTWIGCEGLTNKDLSSIFETANLFPDLNFQNTNEESSLFHYQCNCDILSACDILINSPCICKL